MDTDAAPISTDRLSKQYGQRTALDGLSFDVRQGECFALLGPNGAGKTTALEILQGVRTPSSGTATVLGCTPATGDRRWRTRIGVVGQTVSNGLDLTVTEALNHFAHYHSHPRRTDELLAAVDLVASADVRMPKLSGGQRRRLEVALAIQGVPELLFLDEPTTGLDPVARRSFWQLVEDLKAEGTTILLTTHYLEEAQRLADRVGVMNNGRLVALAPTDELAAGMNLPTRIRYRVDGHTKELHTTEPIPLLRQLLTELPELDSIDVREPSLEDAYLAMIGQHDDH